MNEATWKPCWIRGSRLEEIVWIGREVIAWCSGLCIVFFHVSQKKQTLCWCAEDSTGKGACCLAGHASLPVFAFSEKVHQPRILVFTYPTMNKVAECKRGCANGYLATGFTSLNHLVSIGSYPDFPLIVWCWRTGEKIAMVETRIRDNVGQVLRITQSGPTLIAQIGKSCGELVVWELDIVDELAILQDYKIELPMKAQPFCVDWRPGPDPLLAITDRNGHIFLSNADGSDVKRIVLSQRCGICVEIELPAICWFRGGIILRTTFCQIRFLKRNPKTGKWHMEWYIKSTSKPCLLVAHPLKTDKLFYHTLEGFFMQIDFPEHHDNPVIRRHLLYGAIYRFVDFVRPWCHHLVAMDDEKELSVLDCYGGTEITRLDPEVMGEVSSLAAHPEQPMVALTTFAGELVLISLVKPTAPTICAYIHLQRAPLSLSKFSYHGRYLLVGEKKTGKCFCLSILQGRTFEIVAQLETEHAIADVILLEGRTSLKVMVLCGIVKNDTMKEFDNGNEVLVYDISGEIDIVKNPMTIMKLHAFFRRMNHAPGEPQILVGSPHATRLLHTIKINNWKSVIILDVQATKHQVRRASVYSDHKWLLTAAMDGYVTVRKKVKTDDLLILMTHHKRDLGVKKAIMSTNGELIVSMGRNGSLIALKSFVKDSTEISAKTTNTDAYVYHVDHDIYKNLKTKIYLDYTGMNKNVRKLLEEKQLSFALAKETKDKTWVEWGNEVKLMDLDQQYLNEKSTIRQEFLVLKATLKNLLDVNEVSTVEEKLAVSVFDLDEVTRKNLTQRAKEEADALRVAIETECSTMGRIAGWIKRNFWDPQIVPGQSIFAIFGDVEVDNYPMVPHGKKSKDGSKWSQFGKELTCGLLDDKVLQKWQLHSWDELEKELRKAIRMRRDEERRKMDALIEEDEKYEQIQNELLQEEQAYSGMTTHRYLESSPDYYPQMESNEFIHVLYNNRFLMEDREKLHSHFNKLFKDAIELKGREVTALHEKNKKLWYVNSELGTMFNVTMPGEAVDYQWLLKEEPGNIIKVYDTEVQAKPYISPSEQEILDKETAEAERLRLLMMADDFRERALMAMMDGMLEVRWEDIIKRDVPMPECMLRKKPEAYTAQDIVTVKKYHKAVEALQLERERYRRILENDYTKMWILRQEGIDVFNTKQCDLLLEKIKIDTAINQLNFQYARGCMRNLQRIVYVQKDDELHQAIIEKTRLIATMEQNLYKLEVACQSFQSRHDGICTERDSMSKKMLSEFQFYGKIVVGMLEHLYNRRPKANLRLGVNDLLNLSKYVFSRIKPDDLPAASADYLRQLDNLDVPPVNLPIWVESVHWQRFCQLRRQKIVLELQVRVYLHEINEALHKIDAFSEKISRLKVMVDNLRTRVEENLKLRENFERNMEIQLVLKMGQVEILIRGGIDDASNVIFIPHSTIDEVNKLILEAGRRKLATMSRIVQFRRGILYKEWSHKSKGIVLRGTDEELEELKRLKVTREIRDFLMSEKRAGRKFDTQRDTEKMLQEHERLAFKEEKTLKLMNEHFQHELKAQVARLLRIQLKISTMKKRNALLDELITKSNVARCEMEQQRDIDGEVREREFNERRWRLMMKRSDLVKKLRENYAELLLLQEEREYLISRRHSGIKSCKTLEPVIVKRKL